MKETNKLTAKLLLLLLWMVAILVQACLVIAFVMLEQIRADIGVTLLLLCPISLASIVVLRIAHKAYRNDA